MTTRRRVLLFATVAGTAVTLVATPAAATSPTDWATTDHRTQTLTPGEARTATAPRTPQDRRQAPSRPLRVRRAAPTAAKRPTGRVTPRPMRHAWRPSTTCRPTTHIGEDTLWIVGPGDTLSLIAACHPGVTVDQIRARNGIRHGDLLQLGRRLYVPPAVTR